MPKYLITPKKAEAVWDKLGGEEGVDCLLRGNLVVVKTIQEWSDKMIVFPVTSDGTDESQWIGRLQNKHLNVSDDIKDFLEGRLTKYDKFRSSNGITTLVAIIPGVSFEDRKRTNCVVFNRGEELGLKKLNNEEAFIIRDKLSNEDIKAMGFSRIVMMHHSLEYSLYSCGSGFLVASCGGTESLYINYEKFNYGWDEDTGFAFALARRRGIFQQRYIY